MLGGVSIPSNATTVLFTPGEIYVVRTIHAFFDESGSHNSSPVLCVAGYAFEKREARLFSNEWRRLLRCYGVPFFHMVDCAHGSGPFASLSLRQRIFLQTACIKLIKRRAAHGFAVSVDPTAFHNIMPVWGPAKTPYAFCARCIIDEIGRWFFQSSFQGRSCYFFEDGHQSRNEASSVIASVLENPLAAIHSVHYGYLKHEFLAKQDALPLQAADMLAWQVATDVKHQATGRKRRRDYASMLDMPVRHLHFGESKLNHYVQLLTEFGLDRSNEPATAAQLVRRLHDIHHRVMPALFSK